MKLILFISILLSNLAIADCSYDISSVSGCVGRNIENITKGYLKHALKAKGYSSAASNSSYSFKVIYNCTNHLSLYPYMEKGVYIIQKDNFSNFEETYFTPRDNLNLYFQNLKNTADQVSACVN